MNTDDQEFSITVTNTTRLNDNVSINGHNINKTDLFGSSGFSGQNIQISFALQNDRKVQMNVYDIKGNIIKNLASGNYARGLHTVTWNSKDNSNKLTCAGLYIVQLKADTQGLIKKLSIIR
jgi:flagellar hook assembly protein FlgD